MLIAAQGKFGEDINVTDKLRQNENEEDKDGTISALYEEPVLHMRGQIEENGMHKNDENVYLRD